MKRLQGLALGTLLMLGATSSVWAAGNVPPKPAADEVIEEIIITAKRVPPESIEEIVITAKHPGARDQARTPPVMAIELPRLEFAVAEQPVVRL